MEHNSSNNAKSSSVATLLIKGITKMVSIPGGMHAAHGPGLSGAQVQSLEIGTPKDHPGKILVRDSHGNSIMTTVDELFVATQRAAPDYEITATLKKK